MQTESLKSKSSLKMQYEAEASVIEKKVGNIDQIRGDLGLSKRQLAQLLLVDPSSLTRWQKEGDVPPYIYRSLQWYLALIEKHPEWHPQNRFGFSSRSNELLMLKSEIERIKNLSNQNFESFERKIKQQDSNKLPLKIASLLFCF
ncbi:MAG: hypothetical protein MK008_02845 [Bdellovibrionales bacterium]|nr:hypothetical protein [Bdellovibrionales bacterium]